MPPPKTIYLLTDFGFAGQHYVTQMRGVIQRLGPPDCSLEDISHAVEPFSIIQAEYFLITTAPYLKHPWITVVVVDPGVGSTKREIVAIKDKEENYFIGPNNGIFGRFPPKTGISDVRKIENPKIIAVIGSATFQGRDIMAPVAAGIAKGISIEEMGPKFDNLLLNDLPDPQLTQNIATGGVYSVDSFGNVITNIPATFVQKSSLDRGTILHAQVGGASEEFIYGTTFSDVQEAGCIAYIGSSLFLELGINQGSAGNLLHARIGDRVRIEWE